MALHHLAHLHHRGTTPADPIAPSTGIAGAQGVDRGVVAPPVLAHGSRRGA
jgi:hypothetical protein